MPPLPSDTATVTAAPDNLGAQPPRRPPGPSTRPALIPVGIAALVLLIGGIGAALTTSGSARQSPSHRFPTVRAAGIKAVPGRGALGPIVTAGQPPSDILNVVPLPAGAQVKNGSKVNNTIGLYDHSLSFTIPVSEQKVITFYRAELRALKWQLVSQGPPPHGVVGYQIVGQHPSSDGYEWEVGVTITPTTFGAGTGTAETTPFTLRLFAVTDD
ncbi:MAG TPA: hypothetical protein VIJ09_01025 [Acidimicrobiales bacterium]|jgi:hypothetical protein